MTEWVDVDLSDYHRLGGNFRAARLEIPRRLGRGAGDEIGRIVVGEMREEAPERTGKLKAGLFHRVMRVVRAGGGGFAVNVFSGRHYTRWVIEGRGWVYPVRAQVLHWVDESGEDVFSMYARPTDPNPFHERGWERARPKVEARWTMTAEGIVKQIATS
jgi:hypothetical protein